MIYNSKEEQNFVDAAIENKTYCIDRSYRNVAPYAARHDGYNFLALGVTDRNTDRVIVRALYRKMKEEEEHNEKY